MVSLETCILALYRLPHLITSLNPVVLFICFGLFAAFCA
jgi:hypothetical protein